MPATVESSGAPHSGSGATIAAVAAPLESFVERWGRRAVTLPLYTALCVLMIALLPVWLVGALVVDVVRRRQWATLRCMAFFTWYLCCEVAGVVASGVFWLTRPLWAGADEQRYLDRHWALQHWWARTLFRGAARIFRLRTEVEGDDQIGDGPILLFIRHASVGDTLLPAVILSSRHGFTLRYVLKRELLWDPCLDIVGNRLPNYFVRRGSGESDREIAAVQRLTGGLGRKQGVLIYPEGTRFTAQKRAHILARLAEIGHTDLAARAQALRHVLPPRLGGPLGLLAANPGADVVFCAHVGFDGAGSFKDLANGALVGQTIRVCFWRVPAADIPPDRAAQTEWLYEHWARIDAWVGRFR